MAGSQTSSTKSTPSSEEQARQKFENARAAILQAVLTAPTSDGEVSLVDEFALSGSTLAKYVTLDWVHRNAIRKIRSEIARYAQDRTRRRPLNILMQAEPGSGKSHLVRCLAESLRAHRGTAVDYNLASLQQVEDLIQPLDAVRNLKVADRLPVLFLDEFDSDPNRYALLLPLLWDGELNVAHRNLKLGKVVIVLAGSKASVAAAMKAARSVGSATPLEDGKLVDLVSRVNGGELDIPGLDLVADGRDRRVDKVCLAISLLQSRFGEDLHSIPLSLLNFVALTTFRYGVRSIAHLIDLIAPKAGNVHTSDSGVLTSGQLKLPLSTVRELKDSSLAYHLFAPDGAATLIECWKNATAFNATVRVMPELADDDIPF